MVSLSGVFRESLDPCEPPSTEGEPGERDDGAEPLTLWPDCDVDALGGESRSSEDASAGK